VEPETGEQFREGEPDALRRIIQEYQAAMYRLGLRIFGQAADAQDFVQDLFLHIYEKRRLYHPDRPFRPWLYRVAMNLARGRQRRKREYPWETLPEKPQDGRAEDLVLAEERDRRVGKALQRCRPLAREILALRFETGASLAEMAEILGISLGTVKSRLSRALEDFQRCYLALGGDAHDLP